MQDIQNNFSVAVGNALMEGLVKIVLSPSFMKMLPAGEFNELARLVEKEIEERQKYRLSNETPEAQLATLVDRFGADGNKRTGETLKGCFEVAPDLSHGLGNWKPYNFPIHRVAHGYEIILKDPKVKIEANELTRRHFRECGAITCYEVDDHISYFVKSPDESALVHINNITQCRVFCLGTTLRAFSDWSKMCETRLAEK